MKILKLLSSFMKLGGIIFTVVREFFHHFRKEKLSKKLDEESKKALDTKDQRELERMLRND